MKKLIFGLAVMASSVCFAQNTLKNFFENSNVTTYWLGIDFTHLRIKGEDNGKLSEIEVKNKYFTGWNELIIKEPKKYDLSGAFRKDEVKEDLELVMQKNSKANVGELFAGIGENINTLDKDKVKDIVKSYNFEKKDGYGILFVMESMDKIKETGSLYAVIIDLKTSDILLCEKLDGEPGGFGFRNYWASVIAKAIKSVKQSQYAAWKKSYKWYDK